MINELQLQNLFLSLLLFASSAGALNNSQNFTVTGFSKPFSITHETDELVIEPLEGLLRDPQALLSEKELTVIISSRQALLPFDVIDTPATQSWNSEGAAIEVKHEPITLANPHIRVRLFKPPIKLDFPDRYPPGTIYSAIPSAIGKSAIVADYCGRGFILDIELKGAKTSYGKQRIKYDIDCQADIVFRIAPDVLADCKNRLFGLFGAECQMLNVSLLTDYLRALRSEGLRARVESSLAEPDRTEQPKKNELLNRYKPKYLVLLGDNAATGVYKTPYNAVMEITQKGITSKTQTFPDLLVDDAITWTFGSEPVLISSRIPGGQKTVENYLQKMIVLRNNFPILSSNPRIFADACGSTPDNCFMSEKADVFSQHLFGKKCEDSKKCFFSPEFCKITTAETGYNGPYLAYGNGVGYRECDQRTILNQELKASTLIAFIAHGNPAESLAVRYLDGREQNSIIFGELDYSVRKRFGESENFSLQGTPVVFSGGCFNGALGGGFPTFVIQSGARNFIGAVGETWGRPPILNDDLGFLKIILDNCKQGKTIGESYFEAKKQKTREAQEADLWKSVRIYNIAQTQLYGDPTLKCS